MGTGNDALTEQVASGLLEAGYSFGQLITLPLDLAFDTDLTSKLDNLYEEIKYDDPDNIYEQFTKTMVEYGVPLAGIGKIAKPLRAALRARAGKIANKYASQ